MMSNPAQIFARPTGVQDLQHEIVVLQREQAEDVAAEAAAAEAKRQAEQAERQERIEELASPIADQDVPDDSELGTDTSDLPPMRGRLVRLAAWIADHKERLARLEAGRAAYLQQLGVPALTKKALDDLVEADKSDFLNWLRSGAAFARPTVREFEKARLETQLAEDTYAARTAREGLAEAELEIDVLLRRIELLERRRSGFVNSALIEHAESQGAKLNALCGQVRAVLGELLGLAVIVGSHDDYYRSYRSQIDADVDLPSFALRSLPGSHRDGIARFGKLGIRVTEKEAVIASLPWRELAKLWRADPRAEPVQKVDKQGEVS